jgi:hypothetical protein
MVEIIEAVKGFRSIVKRSKPDHILRIYFLPDSMDIITNSKMIEDVRSALKRGVKARMIYSGFKEGELPDIISEYKMMGVEIRYTPIPTLNYSAITNGNDSFVLPTQ